MLCGRATERHRLLEAAPLIRSAAASPGRDSTSPHESHVMTRRLGMGGHQSSDMGKDEWLTPPGIIRALGVFDLDPCSPIVRPWPTAAIHYTIEDNGLRKPWADRVWLNPPYGPPSVISPWMRRMAEHGNGTALISARTETELFFETVWNRATALLFLKGRLYFHHVDGTKASANAGAPSVLIAYGKSDAEILKQCGIAGHFVHLRNGEAT